MFLIECDWIGNIFDTLYAEDQDAKKIHEIVRHAMEHYFVHTYSYFCNMLCHTTTQNGGATHIIGVCLGWGVWHPAWVMLTLFIIRGIHTTLHETYASFVFSGPEPLFYFSFQNRSGMWLKCIRSVFCVEFAYGNGKNHCAPGKIQIVLTLYHFGMFFCEPFGQNNFRKN